MMTNTTNNRHAWTNEGLNRVDRDEVTSLAQEIANREGRYVRVEHDTHGGYPWHYRCLEENERFSSFGRHAFTVFPEAA